MAGRATQTRKSNCSMNRIAALCAELGRAIEKAAGRAEPLPERRFHKHKDYLSYGLKSADFYALMKRFRPRFVELTLDERLELAASLLGDHIGELGHTGIYILALSTTELKQRHFTTLDRLMDDFRSWSHVDHFCSEVLKPLLNLERRETLAWVERWNRSDNRFKRRASVVLFTRKVAESAEFTVEVLRLCENLLQDREEIVRKGVGWALKDNLRSAPQRLLPYIVDLRRRGISSTIVLYAIRDLKGPERERVLAVKKNQDRTSSGWQGE